MFFLHKCGPNSDIFLIAATSNTQLSQAVNKSLFQVNLI